MENGSSFSVLARSFREACQGFDLTGWDPRNIELIKEQY